VLPMPPMMGALRNLLSADTSWSLVYFDDYYLVYLKRKADNIPIIAQWGYKVINPLSLAYGLKNPADIDLFGAEAERAITMEPNSALANTAFGYFKQQSSDFITAAEYYKKAIGIRPNLVDMYRSVAEMYANAGEFDSAKVWLETAKTHKSNDPWVYFYLGILSARHNDLATAKEFFKEALILDPGSPAKQMLEKIHSMTNTKKKAGDSLQ
jgi:tetratricopeptide (TPR) repeat protein